MQTDLQMLLLIMGSVFVMYVVYSLLKRRRQKNDQMDHEDFEHAVLKQVEEPPHLDDDPLLENKFAYSELSSVAIQKKVIEDPTIQDDEEADYSQSFDDREAPAVTTSYIALTVMAKDKNGFAGRSLLNTLSANHFHYSAQEVFNRHLHDNPSQITMFSVLSMLEPGTFDPSSMVSKQFPGIVLLMVLPNDFDSTMVFEKMLTSARQLAVQLDGELCDASRKPLNASAIAQLRERIQDDRRRVLQSR